MIKNGDLPAMALYDIPVDVRSAGKWIEGSLAGLTKREQFAMAAMQGLLTTLTKDDDLTPKQLARSAVLNADALLEELERTKGE